MQNSLLMQLLAIGAVSAACSTAFSGPPESTRPIAGIRESKPGVHAIEHVRLVMQPGKIVEDGTIVVRDGVIEAIGADVASPADARVWDGSGKTVYAGFIDAYSEVAAPAVAADKGAPHWNRNVTPQSSAIEGYTPNRSANEAYREQGFIARLVAPKEGIFKGTSGIVSTGDGEGDRGVVAKSVGQHLRLTAPRGRGEDSYPNSPMGAVALARQTMYDAKWLLESWGRFESGTQVARPEQNDALVALGGVIERKMPIIADAMDEQYFLRSDAFAREFGLDLVVRSYGHEYRRLDAIAAAKRPVIVSLDFPKPPEVSTAEAALDVSLERLMHWDHAPANPGVLANAGVTILLTGEGLEKRSDFWPAMRKAVRRGLDRDKALAALTTAPAEVFGLERYGSLEPGKAASFVLVDHDPFTNDKAKFTEVWVDGERYELESPKPVDLRGNWSLKLTDAVEGGDAALSLSGEADKLKGAFKQGNQKSSLTDVVFQDGRLSARFKADEFDKKGTATLTATLVGGEEDAGSLIGSLVWPEGSLVAFVASSVDEKDERVVAVDKDREPVVAQKPPELKRASFPVNFPLGDYGRIGPVELAPVVAFTNATVWTCGDAGVIEGATVVIDDGVIRAVGTDVEIPAKALVFDCQGKHLSPGLIDCHSHMGTDGGINESTQSVTAEVRVGDFINANDIDIYRQLAGGVTTSNILHGSANPIGGQNQVIKLRWGLLPEELKFKEAPPGIKFALGENVKQSNWGERYTTRYPQTRMGVEQIIRDRFVAAREYRHRQKEYAKRQKGMPPRVDLELEALAEVVNGERWIHCHSYRQDEILALLRTLDEFGVTIGTLQHILEGYKIADEMAKHGAGGSAFSDWWAYKFEVYDAIPYAGALMHKNGVTVSFNSDDRELARHLNQEAAKAMKYGGVSAEEALKFVTLNPAKQLRIDQYVGSIEPGKHADLIVWSREPLSNLAVCEQSWIDGRRYFDRTESKVQADLVRQMKAELIQKVLSSGEKGVAAEEDEPMERELWPREDQFCRCRVAQ